LSGGLLSLTAVGKLITVFQQSPIIDEIDPIVGVQTKFLLLTAALLESVIVVWLLQRRSSLSKNLFLAWFGTAILLYRAAMWLQGAPEPCKCLGALGGWLPFSPYQLGGFMLASAVYLLTVSAIFLWLGASNDGAIEKGVSKAVTS